ncbi:MAG: hypothetical protein RDV41_15635, partial [Planctomycetota bacterium]|nr:hypothetical protein [Planctomycetota bacterium]
MNIKNSKGFWNLEFGFWIAGHQSAIQNPKSKIKIGGLAARDPTQSHFVVHILAISPRKSRISLLWRA